MDYGGKPRQRAKGKGSKSKLSKASDVKAETHGTSVPRTSKQQTDVPAEQAFLALTSGTLMTAPDDLAVSWRKLVDILLPCLLGIESQRLIKSLGGLWCLQLNRVLMGSEPDIIRFAT